MSSNPFNKIDEIKTKNQNNINFDLNEHILVSQSTNQWVLGLNK